MAMRRWLAAITSSLLLVASASAAVAHAAAPGTGERRTARQLESIRDDPAKLHAFLAAMPKGGDLHNHLSGAVPTETLIGYAVEDGLCIDTTTLTAMPAPPAAAPCP
ncbi:MAG: adenosine deaminase, partial [Solirubrobacteraceae bacterium]|nr:adenosine deaminase [Solirubrobacteraceae bacterium]